MYSAPELSSLSYYNESIDIWGVGIAFAEMLFKVSHLIENRRDQTIFEMLEAQDGGLQISDESVSLLKSMLSEEPNLRPTIYELSDQLNA